MDTFKNDLVYKKVDINKSINYEEFYNHTKKDIVNYRMEELAKLIIENKPIRQIFFEYLFKNKDLLKDLVWNNISERINQKRGNTIDVFLQTFYTRTFDYCQNEYDFHNTLIMTPEVEKVLEEFLKIIFISTFDIKDICSNLLYELEEERKIFSPEEFKIIFKEEFLQNIKSL